MTAIRFRCPKCGSTDGVVRDAFASWDEDTQEWVLSFVYDNFFCNECGANDIDPEEETIEEEATKSEILREIAQNTATAFHDRSLSAPEPEDLKGLPKIVEE